MTRKVSKGLGVLPNSVDAAISSDSGLELSANPETSKVDKPSSSGKSTSSVVSTLNERKNNNVHEKSTPKAQNSSSHTESREVASRRRLGVAKKYEGEVTKTTIMLPSALHDALLDICHLNRKSSKETLNDLYLQGLETVVKKYGLTSIDNIIKEAEKLETA